MRTGTRIIYRIFTFTLFITILAFIAGSLNLSAKRDNNTFQPYKANTMPPSVRPAFSEASGSDMPVFPETEIPEPAETEPVETEPVETEPADSHPAETEPAEIKPAAVVRPAETEPAAVKPTAVTKPEEPESTPDPSAADWKYSFAGQIPESDSVDAAYFKNALFIGDSRTVGFCNFSGIAKYCYARVSLNIKSVLTAAFIEDNSSGKTVARTVLDTVRAYPKSFDKIYVSFGVNEYSWPGTTFIACYEYFIKELRDILPENVPIYILSVLPVDEKAAQRNGYYVHNSQLDAFNSLLSDMSGKLGVHFVNTAESVTAEDAFSLPEGLAGDGVHLNKPACLTIKDYLYTHTAEIKKNG